ncbi:MAG: thiamine pyrophosphate-dependent enzyme [Planctomycetota bacterium]
MATRSPKPERGAKKKRSRRGSEEADSASEGAPGENGRSNGRGAGRAAKKKKNFRHGKDKGPSAPRGPRATTTPVPRSKAEERHGLKKPELMALYRTMLLSREIDDEEIRLKQKNQIFFQINGAGHEALGAAAGMALRSGKDWFFPYYRDRALMLQLGMTPVEMLKMGTAAHDEPAGSGRQMPSHWGHPDLNVPNQSSCTGSQALHAVGCAEAWFKAKENEALRPELRKWSDEEIAFISVGDGTTSEGEVWEAFNSACNLNLPVLFLVEDTNSSLLPSPIEIKYFS